MTEAVLPNTAQVEAPPVLLPYQQRWIAIDAQLKVAEKSRRIGLTWAEAADDVLIAASAKDAGGMNVYYIGYNQDMAIEFVEACAMWAKAFNHAASEVEEGLWEEDQEDKHIKTYTIRFPESGHRIVALSSRPANLRGKQGVVVIDEAAFHDALEELLKAALALLIWGGFVRVISTHDGVTNPFNELILELRQLKRKGEVFRCTFKEAVAQGLYKRVCLRLGKEWSQAAEDAWVEDVYDFYGDAADEELDVIPSQSSGTYLPAVLVESRLSADIPVIELERSTEWGLTPVELRTIEIKEWCDENLKPLLDQLDPNREYCFGEDFARNGDLTVLNPAVIESSLKRRIIFQLELRNMPFAQQRETIYYILDRLPCLIGAAFDSRGNGQQIAEEAADRYGHEVIHQVMITRAWYAINFPLLKKAYEDDSISAPKHANVSSDLRAVKVDKGVPVLPEGKTNERGKAQRHGDTAVAQVMMWFASLQDPPDTTVLSGGYRETSTMFQGIDMTDGIWIGKNQFMSFSETVDRSALTEEIASRSVAWDWTGMLGLLPDPDPVLQAMGEGSEVLERLTADSHLCSVMQQRKLGTLKKEFRFELYSMKGEKPSPAAVKLRDQLVEDLERVNLYDLISGLLDAPYYGMTPSELKWQPGSGRLRIKDLAVKPARWFGFTDENEPRFISSNNPWDGEKLPFGKFVLCRHFPTYDNPYGLRLLSRCFWPVVFKKGGIKFWVTLAEKYGMPFMVGEYAKGTSKEDQATMLANLAKMVRDAVAVIPQGGAVRAVETNSPGKAEIHSGLVAAMNAEMSKVIMGQTLTAEVGDKGSLAAGQVHEDVLDDFRAADQKLVKTSMEEIAWLYGQVNAPGVPTPVFTWHEDDDPKKDFAERDKTLSEGGNIRFTKSYYVRQYNLQEGDFKLVEEQGTQEKEEFSEGGFTSEQQALEGLADHVTAQATTAMGRNETRILAAITEASSYEDAMERLLELYPELDVSGLEDLLNRALLNADLFGRSTADQEA